MTRQKKEIIKKMDAIDNFIAADRELGCGFAPAGAYKELEEEWWKLFEELSRLRHYEHPTAMINDMMYEGEF